MTQAKRASWRICEVCGASFRSYHERYQHPDTCGTVEQRLSAAFARQQAAEMRAEEAMDMAYSGETY